MKYLKFRTKHLAARFTVAEFGKVKDYCQREGITVTEIIRLAFSTIINQ